MQKDPAGHVGRGVTRIISIPASVSEQAQQFLAMDMFGGDSGSPDLADVEGWRTMIKELTSSSSRRSVLHVKHLRLDCPRPAQSGSVPVFVVTPDGTSDESRPADITSIIHGGGLIIGRWRSLSCDGDSKP